MGKPTEAASDGRGTTAAVLQFPALVSVPVENIRWRGCYPRGVVALSRARASREAQAEQRRAMAERDRIRAVQAEYLASVAQLLTSFTGIDTDE